MDQEEHTEQEGEELEYLDPSDIQEELEVGEEPQEDDHDMEQEELTEIQDNSIQGFFEHNHPVFATRMSPVHPGIAASGGGDDKSYLWSTESGERIYELGGMFSKL